ncbi:hypothetical protein [Clostridium sp.]|uniref:restriction endonuclease-related protein n=1 Tax=Clostridium sp. TaxID=1506 RepID=UPI003D6CF5F2
MNNFIEDFSLAFDLTLLGLYKKKNSDEEGVYCALLKKALDKFSYLNEKYRLLGANDEYVFPFHENMLITTFEKPLSYMLDKLPQKFRQDIQSSRLYHLDALLTTGNNHTYHLLPEAFEILERREFFKSKDKYNAELEYKGQKLYLEMINKGQLEYEEIRSFLTQQENAYIVVDRFSQTEEQQRFIKGFPDICYMAYNKLPESTKEIKVCPCCGLVIRENDGKDLRCVSQYCSQHSKGFINVKSVKIDSSVMILNEVVAHNIYYPGQLEMQIKTILNKKKLEYILWPNMDEWDFNIMFKDGSEWLIDAKVVENPYWIQADIEEKITENCSAEKIIYVVPNRRSQKYLQCVRKSIGSKNMIYCMKLNELEVALKSKMGEQK